MDWYVYPLYPQLQHLICRADGAINPPHFYTSREEMQLALHFYGNGRERQLPPRHGLAVPPAPAPAAVPQPVPAVLPAPALAAAPPADIANVNVPATDNTFRESWSCPLSLYC